MDKQTEALQWIAAALILIAFVMIIATVQLRTHNKVVSEMAAIQKSTESIMLSVEEVEAIQTARVAQVNLSEIVEEYIKRLQTHKENDNDKS